MSRSRIKLSEGATARARILLVDDDLVNLKLVAALLEPLDIDLVTAESAEEAFSLLRTLPHAVDLILLDRLLPGVSGLEFLHILKQDPSWVHIPVVIQTADATPAQVREGIDAGAAYCLIKPVDPTQFQAIVRSALREAREYRLSRERPVLVGASRYRLLRDACFEFQTLSDARELANELSMLCPNPETASLGLLELIVNAIEHGNLEISFGEKSRLCRLDSWQAEVERRLMLPAYRGRFGSISVTRARDSVTFVVRDQGPGFRWQDFLEFQPSRAFEPNGRGIALAKGVAFSELWYDEPGNVVTAEIHLEGAS